MGGAFVKNVENGGGVVKNGKWGVFFVKKSGPFLNAGCIMYSRPISTFYFTFYLFWMGAYAPNAPPLPTGLKICVGAVSGVRRDGVVRDLRLYVRSRLHRERVRRSGSPHGAHCRRHSAENHPVRFRQPAAPRHQARRVPQQV